MQSPPDIYAQLHSYNMHKHTKIQRRENRRDLCNGPRLDDLLDLIHGVGDGLDDQQPVQQVRRDAVRANHVRPPAGVGGGSRP